MASCPGQVGPDRAEQFAEEHLRVTGRDRRFPGLVVVTGVVEEIDPPLERVGEQPLGVGSWHPLERAPRSERDPGDLDLGPAEKAMGQRGCHGGGSPYLCAAGALMAATGG
jgi:hypothetical protein